jgi:hypothetical protein
MAAEVTALKIGEAWIFVALCTGWADRSTSPQLDSDSCILQRYSSDLAAKRLLSKGGVLMAERDDPKFSVRLRSERKPTPVAATGEDQLADFVAMGSGRSIVDPARSSMANPFRSLKRSPRMLLL